MPRRSGRTSSPARAGAGPITSFDPSEFAVHFACELKDFDPTQWIEHRKARRMDRFAQMILAAARMAEEDSGFDIEPETERTGVSVATGIGGLQSFQDCYDQLLKRGPDRVNPLSIPAIIPNMGAAWVSMELGTRGPLTSECTACAASNMAIGEAMDAIRLDRADVMFAGGTEAGITKVGIGGFYAMRALSRRNDDPRGGQPALRRRPRRVRDGRGRRHRRPRGARARPEARAPRSTPSSIGYGVSSDAHHITEPDPTGRHPARAMAMAMEDAGITADQIDYINAHGTSTPIGDASETRVIKIALGEEKARRTPISSTKGATGHCLGASGAIEAIVSTLAVQRDVVPPTINYEVPDPECDLDYIPNKAREWKADVALSNNFGFGGHNACLVIRKFTD